jgi:hypothetical protein
LRIAHYGENELKAKRKKSKAEEFLVIDLAEAEKTIPRFC